MGKSVTLEEALVNCIKSRENNSYNYDAIKEYNGVKTILKIYCNCKDKFGVDHGYFYQSYTAHVHGHKGCPKCIKTYPHTTEEFIKLAQSIQVDGNGNPKYTYLKTIYLRSQKKVIVTCLIHGDFLIKPHHHLSGKGCPKCYGRKCGLIIGEFIKRANIIFDNFYDYSKTIYVHSQKKVIVTCPLHGDFLVNPNDHIHNRSGCPLCKNHIGEIYVAKLLKDNNINFIPQKTFPDCKYKRKLRFDFYIPEFNILIEYDGFQHFEKLEIFGGKESFILQEIKDEIKNKYCENNNIPLIRLPYWLSNKDLKEILLNDIEQIAKDQHQYLDYQI
jgi:hypothetical protein